MPSDQNQAPTVHWLNHYGVRMSIHTVLLVAERVRRRLRLVDRLSQPEVELLSLSFVRIGLPTELWVMVCSFLWWSDWPA